MHIPDGYLSPSTCAALYAASTPFWYVALQRVKRVLLTRTVPLLSVFSAFSFVVMMFNLPLPGGTTGHAVGMGMAAVVLGPWVSLLAISMALLIQALLFGDGGVTAYGANCFNMAIVGSLAAYAVYRIVARKAALTARRRVIAAALAGYVAINLSALCAAIEFGIQPRFFHDAAGAPLYAPYALHVAIPAMMIGHLTFAGLAELILSAGLVAYLQRADPALLRTTAPDAPDADQAVSSAGRSASDSAASAWPSYRRLWVAVALFLVLTPLGIVAAGTAWGEWTARDFSDPDARAKMAAVSGKQMPPAETPVGLARLGTLWRAPLFNYAPPFIRSTGFGYFVSGTMGVGAAILCASLLSWLMTVFRRRPRMRKRFLEKTLHSLARISEEALFAETIARRNGPLQRLDARVKLAGLGAFLFAVLAVHRLEFSVGLFLASVCLIWFAHVPLGSLTGRVWLAVLGFTGVIALPALFLTPGAAVARVPLLDWPITAQGLRSAGFLLLRSEAAATAVVLVLATTSWHRLLRALRILRVPSTLVVVLEMTYRYIFVFLRVAEDMIEARKTRLLGPPDPAMQRSSAAALAGTLLDKSLSLGSEVHLAMQARGFRGDVQLLDDLVMKTGDWMQLGGVLCLVALAAWVGR